MQTDIRFFQAAATAIPTLFIAIAISARIFNLEEGQGKKVYALTSWFDVTIGTIALTACGTAEMICLATLLTNRPDHVLGIFVGIVIVFQILMISLASLIAALDKFRPLRPNALSYIMVFAFLVPVGTFILLTLQ
jgi:hypothetical protein